MQLSRPLLDRIAADQGSAFYLLDTDRFTENFTTLTAAFRVHYPDTSIAYSYKTNYIPRLVQIVDSLGGYAEVVSSMEQKIAERAGVAPAKVFFNGPFKRREDIAEVLTTGGIVNLDSIEEIGLVREIASDNPGKTLSVGLRCNFDVGDGVLSRFGFDTTGPAFDEAVAAVRAIPNVVLVGLHCHFATRSLSCWEQRTKGMIEILERYLPSAPQPLEFVSLGGGMYGDMPPEMKAQFPVTIPSFADYAGVAARPFADFFARNPQFTAPTLIIEPGTALVADAMKFVAQVVSLKNVRGKPIATLSGSTYNINPTPNRKNVPIAVFAEPGSAATRGQVSNVDFAGYTCIEGDYLYRGYSGELAVGDYVTFDDVGSYSVVMKPPFILPNVAIVEYDAASQQVHVIKRREMFDDLFATYAF